MLFPGTNRKWAEDLFKEEIIRDQLGNLETTYIPVLIKIDTPIVHCFRMPLLK